MPDTLREWTHFLGSRSLPAMASSRDQVARLLGNTNVTNTDLQRIIARDPGFSLELYRYYAGMAKSSKEPPGSPAHAIALLGTASISKLIKRLPVVEDTLEGKAREELHRCYSSAVHAAHYAYRWGRDKEDSNPEELGFAALLYNCGEMALRIHAAGKMKTIEARVAAGADYAGSARAVLGFTLQQLSIALAEQWRLPPLVITALSMSWPVQARAQKVALATALARETERAWNSEQMRDLTGLLAEIQLTTPDRAGAALHTLAAETARDMEGLPLPVTAPKLIDLCHTVEEAPKKAPPLERKKPVEVKKPAAESAPPPRPPVTETAQAPSNPLQRALNLITTRMRKDIGLDRIMFAMLSRNRKEIKARFVMGAGKETALSHFNCLLEKKNIFTVLLSRPQAFWLKEDNRDKYLPLIPAAQREAVDTRGFFAMSIYIRNKPIGLLYADAADPDTLDEEGYKRFKQLCQQLSNRLAGGK